MILRFSPVFARTRAGSLCGLALLSLRALAQTPNSATPATVVLPTFSVSTSLDKGYQVGNSVSATCVDTPHRP